MPSREWAIPVRAAGTRSSAGCALHLHICAWCVKKKNRRNRGLGVVLLCVLPVWAWPDCNLEEGMEVVLRSGQPLSPWSTGQRKGIVCFQVALVVLTVLALEFCFWMCLSCLKPYPLLRFDSTVWLQLGSVGCALAEFSAGFCNGLGSGARTLQSLLAEARRRGCQRAEGRHPRRWGRAALLVGGKSAARGNLQAAGPKIYHWDTMEQTSRLLEYCLPDNWLCQGKVNGV